MPDSVIPFYGGAHPEIFAIERRCMDREGLVLTHLRRKLPTGRILDIGAGDGFTAAKLSSDRRAIVALEPDGRMIDRSRGVPFVRGVGQRLPFADGVFDGAYATWACFFPAVVDCDAALAEVWRVCKPGALFRVIDNAGDDEFCRLATRDIAADRAWFRARGFSETIIPTRYQFDHVGEAQQLLSFYFPDSPDAASWYRPEIGHDVVSLGAVRPG